MTSWNPWRALRASTVEFWFAPLVGERGRWTRRGDHDEILLADHLDRQARREVLAHELVHVERGVGSPSASAATMQLEEDRVWRVALQRLAPAEEVEQFLARRVTVDPVMVHDLAEEFDLSSDAAHRVANLRRLRGAPSMPDAAAEPPSTRR